jgi:hypothetical protein
LQFIEVLSNLDTHSTCINQTLTHISMYHMKKNLNPFYLCIGSYVWNHEFKYLSCLINSCYIFFSFFLPNWPSCLKCVQFKLVFKHSKEWYICSRTPFAPSPISFKTILISKIFHIVSCGFKNIFVEDFEVNQNLELSSKVFELTFNQMLTCQ